MVSHTFEFPETTAEELEVLASLTVDAPRDDPLGTLFRDALRTYEWLLRQQAQGHTITALTPADLHALEATPDLEGERAALADLVPENRLDEARAYFRRLSAEQS